MLFAKQGLVGNILKGLVGLALTASAAGKFILPPEFAANMDKMGIPLSIVRPIGVLELLGVILFLIPRTSLFGAIWLTGYLGGAILTHLRVGEAPIPVIVIALLAWLGYGFTREDVFRTAIAPAAKQ
jgi:hypothetical protein